MTVRRFFSHLLALLACLASSCGSGSGRNEGGALVVRQVLSGNAVGGDRTGAGDPAGAAAEQGAVVAPVPGMSLGSTLIADSPRALYRRAYDQARRRADGDSPRDILFAIDERIDQATSEPSALFEE